VCSRCGVLTRVRVAEERLAALRTELAGEWLSDKVRALLGYDGRRE
jgi:hypothetical protein